MALADVGISIIKYENNQIGGIHLAINTIADACTFIGLPEVTVIWGLIDMGLEAGDVKW